MLVDKPIPCLHHIHKDWVFTGRQSEYGKWDVFAPGQAFFSKTLVIDAYTSAYPKLASSGAGSGAGGSSSAALTSPSSAGVSGGSGEPLEDIAFAVYLTFDGRPPMDSDLVGVAKVR